MSQSVNPFDDEKGQFYVLKNNEEQYSLWPTFAEVPSGWDIVHGAASRAESLDYIRDNWTNILPKSAQQAISDARGNS